MPVIIEPPPDEDQARPSTIGRLAWFFGIAIGSTLVVAAIAYGMKALLR